MRSDKSASNICKLRQWRNQQPSCVPYIVLDDRSRMQCHCNMRRIQWQLMQQVATIQVPGHKICNSVSEMNAAFQFDLARPSGHSEGCHHIKLLQPKASAVQQIWHSEMPNRDRLGFTTFLFQLLTLYWMTSRRWECNMRMQCHWDKRRISEGSSSVQ